ncbi:hypothetical protein [Pedobacter soli]|uniref:Uncharacterized protein n=1 Tax=Pedobacter soli TaxID=390242 RepID=A0A1G6Y0U5_9SPHI|nr:hypothetical protein [Pedobacter soli]SDD83246.1 hypothetical protein SAMN04488024_10890 [Pedobacter soli]
MRKIILIIVLLFSSTFVIAQDTIDRDLINLVKLKLWCELYGIFPNRKKIESNNGSTKGDSLYYEYSSLIKKVKKSPKVYLHYINQALKQNTDSLRKQSVFYKNPTPTILYNYDPYSIKIIDLYRIIKLSLFERNDDFLPEDFRNLSVIDQKNYYGYYEPEPNRKAALKYIMKKFSLNSKEKKFLKNKLNVSYVMDIKKFLDTCEQSIENKEFIQKSIAAFVENKETSLAGLYFYHQLSKDTKNYIPRDKKTKSQ